MEGKLKRIYGDMRYGFIRSNSDKQDYFFHKSDFDGNWDSLVSDFDHHVQIYLHFEPTQTDKGPRAKEVHVV